MRDRGKPQEDKGPEMPAWIVSFADMITLLLAFFVLLQAFALEQRPDLFYEGQGAFRRHIAGLGIPNILFGKDLKIKGEKLKKRYPTEENDGKITRIRVLNPEDEQIRRFFRDFKQMIETKTSEINVKPSNVISTPIRFKPSDASLDAPARKYLSNLVMNLKQNIDKDDLKIYVVGSAADMPAGQEQWLLSAHRAQIVGDFLAKALADEMDGRSWRLIIWGAGGEKERRLRHDAAAGQEFIRIAIIEVE